MTRTYLIRHGRPRSSWGGADPDPGLDDAGRAQAEAVADRLCALPKGERPVRVVSSPLKRCRETAQPTADRLGVAVEIDPSVGEIPTPGGLGDTERPVWLQAAFQGEWSDIVGEIDYDQWRRVVAAAVAGHAGAAVFSHFVAINGVLSVLADDPRVIVFRPDHTSTTVFANEDGRLELLARGDEAVTGIL